MLRTAEPPRAHWAVLVPSPTDAIGIWSTCPSNESLVGRPMATSEEEHQRLRKTDRPAGVRARTPSRRPPTRPTRSSSCCSPRPASAPPPATKLVPIAIVVAILLVIVVVSYRQTIYAYPTGGGAYVVSRENLGEMPSLVAGASLLTDYILTVAVSVAGGVLAIQSAFGFDSKWRVPICLALHRRDDGRQPARPQGVGRAVRPADVPLHRHAACC